MRSASRLSASATSTRSIVTSRTVRGSCWFSRDCSSAAVKVSRSEPNMLQSRPAADKSPTSATTIQAILRFDMANLQIGEFSMLIAAAFVLMRVDRLQEGVLAGTPRRFAARRDALQLTVFPVTRKCTREAIMSNEDAIGPFLSAGTKVRYDGLTEGGPEFGVVVHCWMSEEIGGYDCYVAFLSGEFPSGPLKTKPYILRYAASSLKVIKE